LPEIFADTYALFASLEGARNYRKPLLENTPVTTALNVVELAYGMYRRGQAKRLLEILPVFEAMIVEPDRTVVAEAARFKHERLEAGARCSFVDAWGYSTARKLGLVFLTGDEDFRGVPGVRFLKA